MDLDQNLSFHGYGYGHNSVVVGGTIGAKLPNK